VAVVESPDFVGMREHQSLAWGAMRDSLPAGPQPRGSPTPSGWGGGVDSAAEAVSPEQDLREPASTPAVLRFDGRAAGPARTKLAAQKRHRHRSRSPRRACRSSPREPSTARRGRWKLEPADASAGPRRRTRNVNARSMPLGGLVIPLHKLSASMTGQEEDEGHKAGGTG